MPDALLRVTTDDATSLAVQILSDFAPADHAQLQAEALIDAEMRGHPSHGLLRLPRIVRRIKSGVLDPNAPGEMTWSASSLLAVNGGNGFGPVVAQNTITEMLSRVDSTGVACAAVRCNNHVGMLALYAERVARTGRILIATTTSEALVHPWGGSRALVGTNPLAIGVPSADTPLVFDMSTGVISMGKVHAYLARRMQLEPGWALDQEGTPTTDPAAAAHGAIAPFGGPKGYGLGISLEVLVAALTGTAIGRAVVGTLDNDQASTKGDVFIVIDVDKSVLGTIASYLDEVRRSPRLDPDVAVAVPGDRSAARIRQADEHGFDIPKVLWNELNRLAR